MGRGRGLVVIALATVAFAGCAAHRPPHPATNEFRYTCCNIHWEHPEVSDANYQVGTLLPLGTRVQILKVSSDSIEFQPAGAAPMTLEVRYGKQLGVEEYLSRWFPTTDPRAALGKVPAKRRKLIEQSTVEPGMTRDEVVMSLGYPPAHRTPVLSQPDWHYWQNRWHQFVVFFDGDKVDRVQQ